MMHLNYFRGYTDSEPKATTLSEVVRLIADDASVRDLTEKHRYYLSVGDEKSARQCKRLLPCFAVAVRLSGGKQQCHIVDYTGLTIVDIDHVAPDDLARVLTLVKGDPHTLLAYTTVSGKGVRVIARFVSNDNEPSTKTATRYESVACDGGRFISPKESACCLNDNDDDNLPSGGVHIAKLKSAFSSSLYKESFLTINRHYQQLTGLEPDLQCKNVTRLSGIAHDPAVYYNPEAEPFVIEPEVRKPVGRPRGAVEATKVEAVIAEELERRGVRYMSGERNRYISQACYLMNRYGVSEAACTAWALERFADYATNNDVAAIVSSCYQQTAEHATLRPPQEQKERYASVSAIEEFLTSCVELRRNVITGFPEVREISTKTATRYESVACDGGRFISPKESACCLNGNENEDDNTDAKGASVATSEGKSSSSSVSSLEKESEWRQFTDDDRNSIWRQLSKRLKLKVIRQDISAVVKSDFSPKFNAFEEYIRTLPPWDGTTDHIGRLATSVTVKDDQDYFRTVFKKWMVAFIAAIFDPEEVNHEILVFIGRQGSYKSTWFHYLLPPELRHYFLPKLMSNSGITKDDLFKIAQSGLVCLEEIDNMKQRDLNQLKALTTMRTINERRSYGEFNEFHRHIASFCATGNNRFFLTDHTGNRRFLTFEIESIIPPQTYDYGYEGVYAQAYALWKQGFRYWFNEEENDEINRRNNEFEAPNKEKDLILKYYRAPMPGEACRFLTATDILERINSSVKEQLSTVRIGMVLRDLGIDRIRSGNLRGYRLVENSQADIDLKQKSMGNFTEPHTNADTEA